MENEEASEKVLTSVARSLQSYPFSFQGARIISGQQEGAFGWITVNYLSDNLRKVRHSCFSLNDVLDTESSRINQQYYSKFFSQFNVGGFAEALRAPSMHCLIRFIV